MEQEKSIVLSKMHPVGNVVKSPDGTIHVSCGFTTMRFHERNFIDFTLMLKAAFAVLIEESLPHLLDPGESRNPPDEPPCRYTRVARQPAFGSDASTTPKQANRD